MVKPCRYAGRGKKSNYPSGEGKREGERGRVARGNFFRRREESEKSAIFGCDTCMDVYICMYVHKNVYICV